MKDENKMRKFRITIITLIIFSLCSLAIFNVVNAEGPVRGSTKVWLLLRNMLGSGGFDFIDFSDGTSQPTAVIVDYIRLHDLKSNATSGGTFTSGAWQKRDITEDQDTNNNVSVSSSVIVLEAGTYDCIISCPGSSVGQHRARLYNTSDSSVVMMGQNSLANTSITTQTHSIIQGRFTIAATKNLEIQHRCAGTKATSGLGLAMNFGDNEIYTIAEFWKIL